MLIEYNSLIPALLPRPARRRITRQPELPGLTLTKVVGRGYGYLVGHYLRVMLAGQPMAGRRLVTRGRAPEWIDQGRLSARSTSRPRRRSESRAPSTTRVRREDDECPLMGCTSAKSAKKGCISDLTYDSIQEEKIRISCTREGRNVEYALVFNQPLL